MSPDMAEEKGRKRREGEVHLIATMYRNISHFFSPTSPPRGSGRGERKKIKIYYVEQNSVKTMAA